MDGREYEGEWKDNKMHGRGVFTWKDGKKYIGEYKNDKKSGCGIFIYSDNNNKVYEGYWCEGKQHGIGILRSKDSIQAGEWQQGKNFRIFESNEMPNMNKFINEIRSKISYSDNILQKNGIYQINELSILV